MITNKTIEFIEKEINICNQNIDFQMQLVFESQTNQFKKRYHENEALKLTKKLQLLKQVKSELEAWEESKKYFILNEGCVPFYESTYEYITLKNDCIDESNSEEEGISIIKLKKALEVE